MAVYPSSGTYRQRTDLSAQKAPLGAVSGAIVIHSNRGSEDFFLATSEENFVAEFGKPDTRLGYGHYAAIPFFAESQSLYVLRAPGAGALRSGVEIIDTPGAAGAAGTTTAVPWAVGKTTATVTNVFPAGTVPVPLTFAANSKFHVFARNSGIWGNNLHVEIQNIRMVNAGANQEFDLLVFENGIRKESHTVSLDKHLDGYGVQTFIEERINTLPSLISVRVNPLATPLISTPISAPVAAVVAVPAVVATATTPSVPAVAAVAANAGAPLGGGVDGGLPSDVEIIAQWDRFRDVNAVSVQILIGGGYSTVSIHRAIDAVATARGDCDTCLDIPSTMQSTALAQSYRQTYLGIDSSNSAIYTPDVIIHDPYSGSQLPIPPSGFAAAIYARTTRTRGTNFAPAGLNRGVLTGFSFPVVGLSTNYLRADRDILTPSQVNTLVWKNGVGAYITEQETLQSYPSATSNIGVNRMLNSLETYISNMMDYTLMEPGDAFLHAEIIAKITAELERWDRQRAFQPTLDGTLPYLVVINQTSANIDQGVTPVTVMMKPGIPNKVVILNTVLTTNGASFTRLVKQGGF